MLDLRSLFFIGALTSVVCVIMLWTMRRVHPPSRELIVWGALAEGFNAVGLMLIAVRGFVPDFASVVLANGIGTCGALIIFEAIRRLTGSKTPPVILAVAAICVWSLQLYWGTAAQYHAHRIILNSIVYAGFIGACVPLLRTRYGFDPRITINWGIAFCAVFAVIHLVRLAFTMQSGVTVSDGGMVSGNPVIIAVAVLFSLAPMGFAMILVGLINGRLAIDYRRLANTDTLTGIRTRRSFFQEATRRLSAIDLKKGQSASLMMLDLDHFKQINDTLGHPVGDKLLADFGRLLTASIPRNAVPGRYGGEEFCLFLPGISRSAAITLAHSLCASTRAMSLRATDKPLRMSVSIGVAFTPDDGDNVHDLVLNADRRVYMAKAAGRDIAVFSDSRLTSDGMDIPVTDMVPV